MLALSKHRHHVVYFLRKRYVHVNHSILRCPVCNLKSLHLTRLTPSCVGKGIREAEIPGEMILRQSRH